MKDLGEINMSYEMVNIIKIRLLFMYIIITVFANCLEYLNIPNDHDAVCAK